MSFVAPEDVQDIVETILARVWKELKGIEIPVPFRRIPYDEAMDRYGVDAPDLRFGLELIKLNDLVVESGFKVFADVAKKGGLVKGVNLKGCGDMSRKDLDGLTEFVKVYGAKGLAWVKVKDDGEWQSPIAKFFSDAERAAIADRLNFRNQRCGGFCC